MENALRTQSHAIGPAQPAAIGQNAEALPLTADRSTRRLLRSLARVDLLAIDELGYLNVKPEQTNIFFKLMEERHHCKPTLLTTNMPYPAWQDFLGNKPLTQALLSRLRERCHTITIDGPCLRAQQG